MTLRSGSLAAVSVACAVAAAILLVAAVIERVKPTPEPVARWGLWETNGKALNWIDGTEPYDAIDGAVDIDGDGVPEVLTDMGEIAGDDHIAWIQDLHGTRAAWVGCDGLP